MSLIANEDFQHILRVLNTNVDGKHKTMFALTAIKGITVALGITGAFAFVANTPRQQAAGERLLVSQRSAEHNISLSIISAGSWMER